MKKKSRFLINIALLALSICIMVYGVYSAKQASLTVSGTIGFEAHNANIALTSVKVTGSADKATIKNGSTEVTSLASISGITLTFGGLRFNDDGDAASNWKPKTNIVIEMIFTNNSAFAVKCTADPLSNVANKVTYTTTVSNASLTANGGTTTVKITMDCQAIETFTEIGFSSNISFAKTA